MNANKAAEASDWAHQQVQAIGRAVKSLRGKHSAQWLSDRTNELGHLIPRSTIADIENGRRKYVSTAELSVLAWALEVPPVRLLYPNMPDGQAEVIPGQSAKAIEAAMWFSGETSFIHRLVVEPPAEFDPEIAPVIVAEAKRGWNLRNNSEVVRLSYERVRLRQQLESRASDVAYLHKLSLQQPDFDTKPMAAGLADQISTARMELERTEKRLRMLPDAVVADESDPQE
jgi:hypothetical protein